MPISSLFVKTRLSKTRKALFTMIPVAHGEGRYYADEATLDKLENNGQVLFRYSTEEGAITPESNPNGSARNIAGIRNEQGNVYGMMPHPERACSLVLGNTDGRKIFEKLFSAVMEPA
jgi:phosphoribosylformylglycinamidine (FGAM) synthase-like amidotransferase family enzyme